VRARYDGGQASQIGRNVLAGGEDPAAGDFLRRVIERRKSLPEDLPEEERTRLAGFLKVLANSTSYGIFAEMNRQDSTKKKAEVEVYGLDAETFMATVTGPEVQGRYCFPTLAAFIAGAARLMLALLERCVTDFGGTYAMCGLHGDRGHFVVGQPGPLRGVIEAIDHPG
jgi:hypothetical protein